MAAVAVASCLFGTLGPASRAAYDAGLTPLAFTLWRAAIGTVALAALLGILHARGRDRVRWRALPPRALVALVLAGGTSLVLNLAIFSAFQRTSIALALLGLYTYPAIVAGAAVLIGEERLTRTRAISLTLALAGMAVVVLGGASGDAAFDALGFGLALVAAAMQAVYVLLGRRGFRAIPSEEATFGVLGVTAAGFLALVLVTGTGDVAALPLGDPAAPAATPLGRRRRRQHPGRPLPGRHPVHRTDADIDRGPRGARVRGVPGGLAAGRAAGPRPGGRRGPGAGRRGSPPARR